MQSAKELTNRVLGGRTWYALGKYKLLITFN